MHTSNKTLRVFPHRMFFPTECQCSPPHLPNKSTGAAKGYMEFHEQIWSNHGPGGVPPENIFL